MAEGLGGAGHRRASSDNQISHDRVEVEECLASWFTYLQMLNGLCSAGTRLALSLQTLLSAHDTMAQCRVTAQCLAGWEELTRATNVASHTVKKHVDAAMKDYEILDDPVEKHDILRDNLLTFINLQYQFCVACCKCLGSMAECSCSQDSSECDIVALQQCFERLYSSPPPLANKHHQQQQQQQQQQQHHHNHHHYGSHRSPLPYSLFPLQVQRRWSETAAAEMVGVAEAAEQVRRWSMPWDCRHVNEWPGQDSRSRLLRVPCVTAGSGSTSPDSLQWKLQQAATVVVAATNHNNHNNNSSSSQDGLREAIQLLSCRPGVRFGTSGGGGGGAAGQYVLHGGASGQPHVPGLTLTTYESGFESCSLAGPEFGLWPDSRQLGGAANSRGWPHDSHSISDHSDLSGPRDSDHSHRDSEHSGGSGSAHGDSKDSIHSHHSDYSCSHRESDPGVVDLLSSRKNSSSTDSCISVHSRSGSESAVGVGGESVRSNLYSMWSGNDLPFIKLPESSELRDDSVI